MLSTLLFYIDPYLLVFTYYLHFIPISTRLLVFTFVYLCLPRFATVYWCMFIYVYSGLLGFTYAYTLYLFTPVYSCLSMFTHSCLILLVFSSLVLFTSAYYLF